MNKKDEIENIEKNLVMMAEVLEKILLFSDRNKIFESAETIANVLTKLPREVKNTRLFKNVIKYERLEIKYEDILFFLDDCSLECGNDDWDMFLRTDEDESKLYSYIRKIIQNQEIKKREKVIILLAHMEELILDAIRCSRQPNDKFKDVIEDVAIKHNKEISFNAVAKLYVLGIMYIVFSNTDAYKTSIDKKIPFRNNILHRGIVSYDEEDFETQYDMLLIFIRMLRYIRNKY